MSLFTRINGSEKSTNRNSEHAGEQLGDLIAQAEALMGSLADDGDAALKELREHVEKTVNTAKSALNGLHLRVTQAANKAADQADGYVQSNPWSAIAIAAVAGAMIGAMATRRS